MAFFSWRRKPAPNGIRRPKSGSSFRPSLELLEGRIVLSTFLVTNTNDSGAGSLRDAISRVNADTSNQNPDIVNFQIQGTGPFTINLATELPAITHALWIDGDSESVFLHQKAGQIVLDGTAVAGNSVSGLTINAGAVSNTTIQGLAIEHFSGDGIDASSGGSSVKFRNNVIMTNGNVGIDISGGGSNIQFLYNRITGNYTAGIDVSMGGSNVTFVNNQITGTSLQTGVDFSHGGSNLTFTKNNFTGSHGTSVVNLSGGGSNISFAGNILSGDVRVGLDLTGGGSNITLTHLHVSLTSDTSMASQVGVHLGGAAAGTVATISNSVFDAGNAGTGLLLDAMSSSSSISVQTTDFRSNLVGVSIRGDGTTAGTIDLGGGSLGSTGGNNFRTFRAATATSYAIGLFNVGSSFAIFAKQNLMDVSDPATTIADGTHDTTAGGIGVITVA